MTLKTFFKGAGVLLLSFIAYNIAASFVQIPLLLELPLAVNLVLVVLGLVLVAVYVYLSLKLLKKRPEIEVEATPVTRSMWGILGIYVLFMVLQQLFPTTSPNQEAVIEMVKGAGNLPIAFAAIVVVAPIGEELIFRKVLASSLFPKMTSAKSVAFYLITTGVLFSLTHLSANLYQFLIYAVMGMILGLTYLYKKDIRHSIALHAFNNLLGFISILFLT